MESQKLSPIKRFWLLIKPDSKEIRNIYVYAFFFGLVNLSLPIGIQAIINLIQGGTMTTSWVILVLFVILGVAAAGVLQIQQLKISEHLQQKIFSRAAFDFAYRIPKVKLEALYQKYAPELMNRFFDVVSVQKGLSKILIDFSTASVQTVFGLLLLSLYHPFFIVYSLVLVVLVYSIFKFTSIKGLETSLIESKHKYNIAHWLQELARTRISFKLAGNTDLPMQRTNVQVGKYIDSREDHFKILKFQYILMVTFKVLVTSGLLIVGSILVMEQQMNIGQFVAAEIIILLVIGSIEKLILSLETIYDVLTALEKIGQVSDLELENITGIKVNPDEVNEGLCVEFKNVDFSYPGQEMNVFNDISFKVTSGKSIMIEGDSDSGKTTILYLLAGLYQINHGNIIINDLPIGNYNPLYLRSIIGDCLMDELLFEGSLLENITMGRKNATFENVKWAFEKLNLNDFLKTLDKGFDTQIFPQGKQFSSGIVHKLILARSIVDKPKLLLVKDVFSSMDKEDWENIMTFLTDKSNPWTIFIASQNKELKSRVDAVLLAEDNSLTKIS